MLLIRTVLLAISSRSLIKKNHLHPLFIVQLWRKGLLPFLSFTPSFFMIRKGFFFSFFFLVFLLKVFFELADKEEEEKKERLGNEKTHVHQGRRSHLINWLVKRRKITMWHIPPIHPQQHRCKTDNRQMGINQFALWLVLVLVYKRWRSLSWGVDQFNFSCIDSI